MLTSGNSTDINYIESQLIWCLPGIYFFRAQVQARATQPRIMTSTQGPMFIPLPPGLADLSLSDLGRFFGAADQDRQISNDFYRSLQYDGISYDVYMYICIYIYIYVYIYIYTCINTSWAFVLLSSLRPWKLGFRNSSEMAQSMNLGNSLILAFGCTLDHWPILKVQIPSDW